MVFTLYNNYLYFSRIRYALREKWYDYCLAVFIMSSLEDCI